MSRSAGIPQASVPRHVAFAGRGRHANPGPTGRRLVDGPGPSGQSIRSEHGSERVFLDEPFVRCLSVAEPVSAPGAPLDMVPDGPRIGHVPHQQDVEDISGRVWCLPVHGFSHSVCSHEAA